MLAHRGYSNARQEDFQRSIQLGHHLVRLTVHETCQDEGLFIFILLRAREQVPVTLYIDASVYNYESCGSKRAMGNL